MNDIIVCLFIKNKVDEQLLKKLLEDLGYIVQISAKPTHETWLTSSIVILDESNARLFGNTILKIKNDADPLYTPTVVLVSNKRNELPNTKLAFDAVVRLPVLKNEFISRLTMLMRLRVQSDLKYRLIFENINVGIYRLSSDQRIILANKGFAVILGYKSVDEIINKTLLELGIVQFPRRKKSLNNIKSTVLPVCYESIWKRVDGSDIHVLESDIVFTTESGVRRYYASTISDITIRKLAEATLKTSEKRITYMAYHDALTDLSNRSKLDLVLNLALVKAEQEHKQIALIYVDLDRFKSINDACGHLVGDKVLREIADRLKKSIRSTDLIARVGGDEFVIILMDILGSADDIILPVVNKIRGLLAEPISIDQHILHVKASIGISVYPADGKTAITLFKNADTAMYAAKKSGGDKFNFCTPTLSKRAQDKTILEEHLRSALENNEFHMHYQPKIQIKSGRICGVEALLRWNSPTLGEVLPNYFIPLAEEIGLITAITERVFILVCQQINQWKKENRLPLNVAINISGRSFVDHKFMDHITAILKKHKVDPHIITLEITESVLMQEIESNATMLKQFTEMGLKISIDDFGTGYSSLNYLKYFIVDSLKIDESFVRDIATDPNDALIVNTIIGMAHSLKFKVIAEGVETKEQYDFLKNNACDEIQGYYFCKPMPPEDVFHYIDNKK